MKLGITKLLQLAAALGSSFTAVRSTMIHTNSMKRSHRIVHKKGYKSKVKRLRAIAKESRRRNRV